ncbi:MAG: tetratricopeptide repeat protein [Bacteroidota bacterium]
MKFIRPLPLIALFTGLFVSGYCQNILTDSLENLLKKNLPDSVELQILSDLCWEYAATDAKLSKNYGFRELDISGRIKNKKWLAQSYNDIGIAYFKLGELDSALFFYNKSLSIRKELNDKNLIASSLSKMAVVYLEQGNFDQALASNLEVLKVYEEQGNENYTALTLNNISVIYDKLKNYDKVIEYGNKAIAIHLKNNNDYQAAFCYSNLSNAYKAKGNIGLANDYLRKGLEIFIKYNDRSNEAAALNGIGVNLRMESKDREALVYYQKAYNIAVEMEDKLNIALFAHNLSGLYSDMGNYTLAEKYSLSSLENTEPTNKYQLALIYRQLAGLYAFLNNGKKSKYYLDRYAEIKDSIYNIESSGKVAEMETKYQSEKKDKELIIKDAEISKQQADASRKAIQLNAILIGFLIVLIFSTLILRLFLQKKKANRVLAMQNIEINRQKQEITEQRDEIEAQRDRLNEQNILLFEQKKAITDSINYALRIQQAILPTGEYAKSILGEHFIFFRPKDIVSGDFYWGTKINEWLIISVADCTGHGVPGAFMSMLGVSFLNEIVRKKEITRADQVLNELRKSVIESLQQKGAGDEQKDGMDMSLCVINTMTLQMQFSGANNSLFLINEQKELVEIPADKQPVGIHGNMKPFTNRIVRLKTGDCLYLFSDGFQDQFGGPKYRKYMSKQFKELILNIANKPMNEQKQILELTFDHWKGENEQIDDVTVLGLKL